MPEAQLARIAYEVGKRFISDMMKQGYELWGGRLALDPVVRAHVPPKEVPSVKAQDKRPVADFVHDMHAETGLVDHTLWGYFIGKTAGKTETKETV